MALLTQCFVIYDGQRFLLAAANPSGQIMRYVRHLKLQPGYDPNTTHVVYGQVRDIWQLQARPVCLSEAFCNSSTDTAGTAIRLHFLDMVSL